MNGIIRYLVTALTVVSLSAHGALIVEPGDFTFSAYSPFEANLDLGSNQLVGSLGKNNDLDFIALLAPAGAEVVSHRLTSLLFPPAGGLLELSRCNAGPGVACALSVVSEATPLPFDWGTPIDLIAIREVDCVGCEYVIEVVTESIEVAEPSAFALFVGTFATLLLRRRSRLRWPVTAGAEGDSVAVGCGSQNRCLGGQGGRSFDCCFDCYFDC